MTNGHISKIKNCVSCRHSVWKYLDPDSDQKSCYCKKARMKIGSKSYIKECFEPEF